MKTNTNHAKKLSLLLLAMLLPLLASAEKVQIDGIWYRLIEKAKQAEVVHDDETYADSVFVIPATIMHDGDIYNVTSVVHVSINCPFPISVILSDGITHIGDAAFSGEEDLKDIIIPKSVTSIGNNAFASCSKLTSITIPKSVTSIGSHAFFNCVSLTSITIPDGVKSIGSYAFWNCEGLTTITLPQSIESIGEYAFLGCTKLESIDIPNSINIIVEGTFEDCSNLKKVNLSNSVSIIGESAFENCENLSSIIMPNVSLIDRCAFENCTSLRFVDLPETIFTIDDGAFRGCANISSIIIPEYVTNIGWEAFEGCDSLSTIIFMGSPKLEEFAFSDCPQLLNVYCCSEESGVDAVINTFMDSGTKYATLYVPSSEVKGYYELLEPWNKFGKIVPLTKKEMKQLCNRSQNGSPYLFISTTIVSILLVYALFVLIKKRRRS